MRRAARTDDNQAEIVAALRAAGCTVQPLHMVGRGCPDIMCGRAGRIYLMEIKDGTKPPSARQLTADERAWHDLWAEQQRAGLVVVVESVADALAAVGATKRREAA